MSTYRLPLPIPTQSPLWRRLWDALTDRIALAGKQRRPAAEVAVDDWYLLRDLPESIQRDIGVPASLRDHAAALRERDTIWLRAR